MNENVVTLRMGASGAMQEHPAGAARHRPDIEQIAAAVGVLTIKGEKVKA